MNLIKRQKLNHGMIDLGNSEILKSCQIIATYNLHIWQMLLAVQNSRQIMAV